MRSPLPAILVLLALVQPLAAFEVSRPDTILAAPRERHDVAMATSGNTSLVAWLDQRAGSSKRSIRGVILDAFGLPIGEHDFAIGDGAEDLHIASDGRDYLVSVHGGDAVSFFHVTANGKVHSAAVVPGSLSSLVSADGYYFAAIDSRIVILDARGTVVRTNVPITDDDTSSASLHAARDGRLLVVWSRPFSGVFAGFVRPHALFERDFRGLEPGPLLGVDATFAARGTPLQIAETDDGFLLMWFEGTNGRYSITIQTLAGDGYPGPIEKVISNRETGSVLLFPSAEGLLFLCGNLAGLQHHGLSFLRVDSEGESPFERHRYRETAIGAPAWDLDAVPLPGGFLLAYIRDGQVWVQQAPRSSDPVLVSRSLPAQQEAVAARCGDVHYVAWRELSNDASIVRYRRFDASGVPLDPPNRAVDPSSTVKQEQPSITCGRDSALITWRASETRWWQYRLGGAFLTRDAEPRVIDFGPMLTQWSVAFDGTDYAIVWRTTKDITAERWSESGQRLAVRPDVSAWEPGVLAIGWNGKEFLFARVSHPDWTLRAQRLDRNFAPIGRELLLDEYGADRIAVAGSDQGWLVAREQNFGATRTTRLSANAVVLDSTGVRSGPPGRMALAWNAGAYELLTEHALTTITPDGAIATHRLLEGETGDAESITSGGGKRLVVFSRVDPVHGVRRLFAEMIDARWARH